MGPSGESNRLRVPRVAGPLPLLPKRHSEAHSKLRFERPLANTVLPRGPWI